MRSAILAAVALVVLTSSEDTKAATDEQRSEKQQAKRQDAIAKLTPASVARAVTIEDDPMEAAVLISSADVFTWRGGFTDTVRSDNFLRSAVNRSDGRATYQIYQRVTYSGDWRNFEYANVALPNGLKTVPLTIIDRHVLTCLYGACVLEELVGIPISREELDAVAAQYRTNAKAELHFRFKSNTSFDWNDDLPAVEVVGFLQAVDDWRRSKGIQ